jgi:hypothetical protein
MIQLSGSKPDESGKIFSASVHKELLCFFSPYYAAALKGGFAEATSNTLTLDLPNDRMADVVSWLYSGTIISEEEIDLMKLYVFADEKMMLAFRRSIMSKLICITSISCPMDAEDAIPYLKRLPENCGMFRYLVDFWAGVWCETESVYGMEDMDHDKRIPRTFFYLAMEKLSRIVSYEHTRANTLKAACNFHEHVNYHEWADSMSLPSSSSLTHVLVLTKQLVVTRPQHRRSRATVQKIPTPTKSKILSARYSAWEDHLLVFALRGMQQHQRVDVLECIRFTGQRRGRKRAAIAPSNGETHVHQPRASSPCDGCSRPQLSLRMFQIRRHCVCRSLLHHRPGTQLRLFISLYRQGTHQERPGLRIPRTRNHRGMEG